MLIAPASVATMELVRMSRFWTWRQLVAEHAAQLALVQQVQDARRRRRRPRAAGFDRWRRRSACRFSTM